MTGHPWAEEFRESISEGHSEALSEKKRTEGNFVSPFSDWVVTMESMQFIDGGSRSHPS